MSSLLEKGVDHAILGRNPSCHVEPPTNGLNGTQDDPKRSKDCVDDKSPSIAVPSVAVGSSVGSMVVQPAGNER